MENTPPKNIFSKPSEFELKRALISFSHNERFVFGGLLLVAILSGVVFLQIVNRSFMSEVPTYGGSFSEGILGTPRFINPILAISEADRDLTMLVYSGLVRKTADGGYIPDLAEKYEISPDGLTYAFTLRDNIYFHDGTPITTEDVEFTVQKAKDPNLKSPKRPNWEGVTVQKIDSKNISFILKRPYAKFLENTTIGIVSKNLWTDVPDSEWSYSDYNLNAVGSGPYKIDSVKKNRAGIPSSVSLSSFGKFALGRPYIDSIGLNFYGNEDEILSSLQSGSVKNANSIMPEEATALSEEGFQIKQYPLPRAYGVFFNQSNSPILTELAVRQALDLAVDRSEVVSKVLFGYGAPLFGPIPKAEPESLVSSGATSSGSLAERALTLLQKNGWEIASSTGILTKKTKKETSVLSFSISTVDKPELKAAAEIIKENWKKIGANVEIRVFEPGDFSQNVIRPRKYDAILFGEVIGEDSDPYAFWHSSQRNDPGLNIALYANSKVDKILEEARATDDAAGRAAKYHDFEEYVKSDVPAVFVYSPDLIYVTSPDIEGLEIGQLTVPAERFLNVYEWYMETDWVWKIFSKKN